MNTMLLLWRELFRGPVQVKMVVDLCTAEFNSLDVFCLIVRDRVQVQFRSGSGQDEQWSDCSVDL